MSGECDPIYNIESLAIMFSEHAKEAAQNQKKHLEQFKENYPDAEVPAHLGLDAFNLPRALSVICLEIQRLKNHER